MRKLLSSQCSALAMAVALMPAAAYAQDGDDANQASQDDVIIVTTTRRETDLFTTAGAINSIGGDELVTQGISNALALDNVVPNLRIADMTSQGMGAIQITLRGIGNSSFIEIGDPNVGFHVDGVYMSRPQAAINLMFDAQRMEVARGPQGTLFGRNATVGSINVVNNRPDSTDFAAGIGAEIGNYDNRIVNGYVNVPIIQDVLALRASAFWQQRDTYFTLRNDDVMEAELVNRYGGTGVTGWADSPYRRVFGEGLGDDGAGALDMSAYRVSVEFTPTDNLSAYISYEGFNNNSPAAPQTVRGSEYTAYLSTPHYTDQTIDTLRAEVVYNVGDLFDIKLTHGDQDYFHEMLVDLDAGTSRYSPERTNPQPGDLLTFEQSFYDRAWRTNSQSTELTLASTWDGPVQAMIGYFTFEEDTFRNFWIDLPLNGDGIINFNQPQRIAESEAIFGRIDWDIAPDWHFALGLRQTDDRRRDNGVNRYSSFPGNGDFAAWGSPIWVDDAGITDLEYLCSTNLPVGPCAGVNTVAPGTVTNFTGGSARVPGLNDGFGAAVGSPIYQIQQGIQQTTNANATVFQTAITTDEQLREISALLSSGAPISLIGPAASFPRVFFTEQQSDYVDWSLTLDWTPRDGTFLYGTIATGHKAGSQEIFYHPRLNTFINSILRPEELISYELGWREEFDGVGEGLTLSSTFFFMDYTDKQQSVFVDGGDLFCNPTFGDFNGDGYLEGFAPGLGDPNGPNVPIFNGSFEYMQQGLITQTGPGGQWEFTAAGIQQAVQDCSQGSTASGGALADAAGIPNFLELMQVNFGDAQIAGFEFEYDWRLTASDRLRGYLTWNVQNEVSDADPNALPFDLNDSTACGDRVGGCPNIGSTNGNELPFAPDVTFRAEYTHDWFMENGSIVTVGVEGTYNSEYWLSIWNLDCYQSIRLSSQVCSNSDKQDAYTVFDARVRYTSPDDGWFVEGWVRNLTEEVYATNNMRPSNEDSVTPYNFNQPRMYGIRAAANF